MNKIGIGIDIENTARFKKRKEKRNVFWQKIFTSKEIEYCFSKKNPAFHLAARYAAKEAVIKALNEIGSFSGISISAYKQIEILNRENGVPFIKFKKKQWNKFRTNVSISHCQNMAIASVIIY